MNEPTSSERSDGPAASPAWLRAARWVLVWTVLYLVMWLLRFGKLVSDQVELGAYAESLMPGLVAVSGFHLVGRIRAGTGLRGTMWFLLFFTTLLAFGGIIVVHLLLWGETSFAQLEGWMLVGIVWGLLQFVCGVVAIRVIRAAIRAAIRADVARIFE